MSKKRRRGNYEGNEPSKEGGMLDGTEILAVGFGFYAAIWVAVIYGASFFGPK
jgi:hypothetical protein